MKSPINTLILAAGLGTRMKSSQAKVLHKIGSRPMIARALRAAAGLEPENIFVVVGGEVLTPPEDSGLLAGITRDLVLEWAAEAGATIWRAPGAPGPKPAWICS